MDKSSPEKRFSCDICSRTFSRKHRLQSHLRSHRKRKPPLGTDSDSNEVKNIHPIVVPINSEGNNSLCVPNVSHVKVESGSVSENNFAEVNNDNAESFLSNMADCFNSSTNSSVESESIRLFILDNEQEASNSSLYEGSSQTNGKTSPVDMIEKLQYSSADYLNDNEDLYDEYPFKCPECLKLFTSRCFLNRHLLTHTKEKPFKCEICNKGFSQMGNLKVHLVTHSKVKQHTCYVCGKSFTQLGGLKAHLMTHSQEKPHMCDICNKGFTSKCFLARHYLTHTKEKPHVCDVCGKGFAQMGNLKVHQQIHTDCVKLYTCTVCNKNFSRLIQLDRHYQNH